ncbi:S1 family peptidase [Xanthomonas arboricola]|uniref:S1 family peptidase n=1 Tax=Xanthomonas arboricola TaxID=56448 RepID=UPI0011B0737E|nr:S1 family peptidase [Xanthomonas arboricola]
MLIKALLSTVFVGSIAFATPSFSSPHVTTLTADQARSVDAQHLAKSIGISSAEAARRLTLQEASGPLSRQLRKSYESRLAGIYREWTPSPRIVIRLKGPQAERARFLTYAGETIEVVFIPGASHSLVELAKARQQHATAIKAAFPTLQASQIDERTGELVLETLDNGSPERAAALASEIGMPVRVESNQVVRQLALSGSGALDIGTVQSACTGAFVVVQNGTSDYGLVTAGHCGGTDASYFTLDADAIPVSFAGRSWDGSRDLQWYRVSDETEITSSFYSDDATERSVSGVRWKEDTLVGDNLCFYGQQSGQQCGVVDSLAYQPNLPAGCNGQVCQPNFISVAATAGGLSCVGGDSGGPVFQNQNAYGVLSGGAFSTTTQECTRFFYTDISELQALGIRVNVPF